LYQRVKDERTGEDLARLVTSWDVGGSVYYFSVPCRCDAGHRSYPKCDLATQDAVFHWRQEHLARLAKERSFQLENPIKWAEFELKRDANRRALKAKPAEATEPPSVAPEVQAVVSAASSPEPQHAPAQTAEPPSMPTAATGAVGGDEEIPF
jgi:hypothetical protein